MLVQFETRARIIVEISLARELPLSWSPGATSPRKVPIVLFRESKTRPLDLGRQTRSQSASCSRWPVDVVGSDTRTLHCLITLKELSRFDSFRRPQIECSTGRVHECSALERQIYGHAGLESTWSSTIASAAANYNDKRYAKIARLRHLLASCWCSKCLPLDFLAILNGRGLITITTSEFAAIQSLGHTMR